MSSTFWIALSASSDIAPPASRRSAKAISFRTESCAIFRFSRSLSQRVSVELKDRHAEVDWRGLAAFRNVLVRDYLGIDVACVWHIVSVDLPLFKGQIGEIQKEIRYRI
jgi:hypothetical protein